MWSLTDCSPDADLLVGRRSSGRPWLHVRCDLPSPAMWSRASRGGPAARRLEAFSSWVLSELTQRRDIWRHPRHGNSGCRVWRRAAGRLDRSTTEPRGLKPDRPMKRPRTSSRLGHGRHGPLRSPGELALIPRSPHYPRPERGDSQRRHDCASTAIRTASRPASNADRGDRRSAPSNGRIARVAAHRLSARVGIGRSRCNAGRTDPSPGVERPVGSDNFVPLQVNRRRPS